MPCSWGSFKRTLVPLEVPGGWLINETILKMGLKPSESCLPIALCFHLQLYPVSALAGYLLAVLALNYLITFLYLLYLVTPQVSLLSGEIFQTNSGHHQKPAVEPLFSQPQSWGVCVCARACFWQPHGPLPARLLCSWDFSGRNTAVGCHLLLQGIFPTQGSDFSLLGLLCWHAILHHRATWGAWVGGSGVKTCLPMQEMRVQSLSREDPAGAGNGNPLHSSCLENLTARVAWQATQSMGLQKSLTCFKWLNNTTTKLGGIFFHDLKTSPNPLFSAPIRREAMFDFLPFEDVSI